MEDNQMIQVVSSLMSAFFLFFFLFFTYKMILVFMRKVILSKFIIFNKKNSNVDIKTWDSHGNPKILISGNKYYVVGFFQVKEIGGCANE